MMTNLFEPKPMCQDERADTPRACVSILACIAFAMSTTACNGGGGGSDQASTDAATATDSQTQGVVTSASLTAPFVPTPRSDTPHDTSLSVEQKLAVIRQLMEHGGGRADALEPGDILGTDENRAPTNDKDVCPLGGTVGVVHNGQPVQPGIAFDVTQGQTTLTLDQCRFQPYGVDAEAEETLEGASQNDGQLNLSYSINDVVYVKHVATQNLRVSQVRGGQPQPIGALRCAEHEHGLVKPPPRHSVTRVLVTDPGCQIKDEVSGVTVEIERSMIRSADAVGVKDENGRVAEAEDGIILAAEMDTAYRLGGTRYTVSGTVVMNRKSPKQNNGVWEFKSAAGLLVGRVYFYGDSGVTLMAEPAGGAAVPLYAEGIKVAAQAVTSPTVQPR